MNRRVVITGLGVVAPNGVGLDAFTTAIMDGRSGISYIDQLEDLGFACRVGGVPLLEEGIKEKYFSPLAIRKIKSSGIIYGCIAGVDAWKDAGLPIPENGEAPDWHSGTVFGCGMAGIDLLREGIYKVDQGKVKRLGATMVEQIMESGISAHLGGMLGLGNQVTSNSSACATGTEAVLIAYQRIRSGAASRMLAGSCNSHGPYSWGGFDSMRVLNRQHNDHPERASRPMSASAAGFVPGSGAGALLLEDLESAQKRGARIYAEVLGGALNSGGHRQGGTMTAPNPEGILRCIAQALLAAKVTPSDIDLIAGHLTATMGDPLEVSLWSKALNRKGRDFPWINALKSMVGHCLGASGTIECVAGVLQLYHQQVHPSINCEDLHPEIEAAIGRDRIPEKALRPDRLEILAKSSFGFGDVNACAVFRRWKG
jgi:3-oxoacyl-(acyl-carrier-protein) synthase